MKGAHVRGVGWSLLLLGSLSWLACSDRERITEPNLTRGMVGPTTALESAGFVAVDLEALIDPDGELGIEYSKAKGVNDDGAIVLELRTAGGGNAYLWVPGGETQLLATAGWSYTNPAAIANNGEVVGAGLYSGRFQGFRWRNGAEGMLPLPPSPNGVYSSANGVTEENFYVGSGLERVFNSPVYKVFVWDHNGDNEPFSGSGAAFDVNKDSTIVGWAGEWIDVTEKRAAVFTRYTTRWRKESPLSSSEGEALAINDAKRIVGWQEDAMHHVRPYVWQLYGAGLGELGTLGEDNGRVLDVNESGYMVGERFTDLEPRIDSRYLATLWTESGDPVDLGALDGYDRSHALAINADKIIVGYSSRCADYDPDTDRCSAWDHRATMWTLGGGTQPPATIQELKDAVQDLVDGESLNEGQGNALTSKLNAAQKNIEKGKNKTAANILGAFINQLEDLVAERVLDEPEAQPLIAGAEALIQDLLS